MRRRAGALAAALAVVTGLAGVGLAPAAVAYDPEAPTPDRAVVTERPDHFSTAFADPLDLSNAEDLLVDEAPTSGLERLGIDRGLLSGRLVRPGYVSPLWGGYPGAFFLDREGSAPGNGIPTGSYDRISFSAYVDRPVDAGVFWFTCDGLDPSCQGGRPLQLEPGWHVYDVALDNRGYGLPKQWSGTVTGLRLGLSPSAGPTEVRLDWLRVTGGGGASVGWRSPRPGSSARLFYDSDGSDANNTPGAPGWGPLPCDERTVCRTDGPRRTDVSALPPGQYRFWAQTDDGTASPVGPPLTVRPRPRPVVVDPDAVGGPDYATQVLGDPWDMNARGDVAEVGNARDVSVSGGRLAATNTSNDPFAWFRTGTGAQALDPSRYHRLAITSGYDGAFNLDDRAGGGAHGRVVWRTADRRDVQQTRELVTYAGTRTLTTDLGRPASEVHEEDRDGRDWTAAPVTGVRWDPNEDRGARRWWVDDVALRADDETGGEFVVRWRDEEHRPGSRVTVGVARDRSGAGSRTLVQDLDGGAGTRSWTWDSSSTTEGPWWVWVDVRSASGETVRAWSGGPVRVDRSLRGQGTSPVPTFVRDPGDACPQTAVPPSGLTGLPGGATGAAVDCLAWFGVTRGTSGGGYDAGRAITRGQLATFITRMVPLMGGSLPVDPPDAFGDDAGSTHEASVNTVAAAGIVTGRTDGTYGPDEPVTREQMATFLDRTWAHVSGDRLPWGPAAFGDVGGVHAGAVDRVAAVGVTGGRTLGSYDPRSAVTRGQMAAFLTRLLDVGVQEGRATTP